MPAKKKSAGRIDGITATIIALSWTMLRAERGSIYNTWPYCTTIRLP